LHLNFSAVCASQRREAEAEAPLAEPDPQPPLPSTAREIDARHADDGGDDALEQLADAFSPVFHASSAPYAPYRSFVMFALQQWKDLRARRLSKTAFNELLRLVRKLVCKYPNADDWPTNVADIAACEATELQVRVLCSCVRVGCMPVGRAGPGPPGGGGCLERSAMVLS